MEVLTLMNTHRDWEEILTQSPYYINIKRDGDYILLKYNQLNSDFTLPIVRECRGSIFYKNEDGEYECICRAFDKFGNVGESYVPEIDWGSAVVEEKVDGSLIKVWNHKGQWHVSTNGTIDAYKAEIDDTGWTFGKLFDSAIKNMFVNNFFNELYLNTAYMFELVSPRSKVIIDYPETRLYYLGCRNMITMREYKVFSEVMRKAGILLPKVYPLRTLNDCLEYAKTMTKNEEGFVVKDNNYNRVKIKSPQYLMAAYLNNNGEITTKRIIMMMKNNMLDDFMAYCPKYKDMVDNVVESIINVTNTLDRAWAMCSDVAQLGKRSFALSIQNNPYKDFLFEKFKHPELTGMDYIMAKPIKQIKSIIEGA